jgi:hypothetical protein
MWPCSIIAAMCGVCMCVCVSCLCVVSLNRGVRLVMVCKKVKGDRSRESTAGSSINTGGGSAGQQSTQEEKEDRVPSFQPGARARRQQPREQRDRWQWQWQRQRCAEQSGQELPRQCEAETLKAASGGRGGARRSWTRCNRVF